jgi:PAS domain S-box-containing protein
MQSSNPIAETAPKQAARRRSETGDPVPAIAGQSSPSTSGMSPADRINRKIADLAYAEARHRDSSKRLGEFAAIVENSDDAIISKDLTGRIMSWNPAATRILGYTPEEMIGEPILKIIPEELHPDEEVILAKIRAGERIEHFETVRRAKDGRRLDVSLSISPVRDETGKIIGAAKILRDISARKALEASLLQAEKIAATGRMAATIAHEINNPLEAIVNLIFLARDRATDPEQIAYLDAAESEVGRVSHIAKQTLGYYRDPAKVIHASLSDIAAEAARIYEPRCKAAGIHLRRCLDPTPPINIRKGEIMQVVSNLITNAIYAMPNGGILSIVVERTSSPAEGVVLSIEDTGTGIAAVELPRIFEAFYTTRTTIGTGIGLFVAKQFVEGHGGHIEVQSDTQAGSHGTRMSIFLPLQTQYAAA